MVKDVSDVLMDGFARDTLVCEIPALFSTLEGKDNNFELTTASNAMTLNLFYSWNTAIETIGIVFVNTEILDWSTNPPTRLSYNERGKTASERGELARKTFEKLGLKNIVVHTDLTKAQMIELLNELQEKADSFKAEEGQVLGIFVYTICYFLMK